MTLTGVAAWPALAADVKLSIEIPRLNGRRISPALRRGVARARRPELRRQYRGLVRPQAQGQRGHQVAQGHAPVVAPLRPRAVDAGRRPVQRDASARRAPASQSRRTRRRSRSWPTANTRWSSRRRAKSAAASSCVFRSSGRPRRDQVRAKPPVKHELGAVALDLKPEIQGGPIMRKLAASGRCSRCASALPVAAQAHRVWMLPSATILSGDDHLGHDRRRGVERPVLFRALSVADREHRQAARRRAGCARRAAGPAHDHGTRRLEGRGAERQHGPLSLDLRRAC